MFRPLPALLQSCQLATFCSAPCAFQNKSPGSPRANGGRKVDRSGLSLCSTRRGQIWPANRTHAALPFRPLPESPERFPPQTPTSDTSSDDLQTESYALLHPHQPLWHVTATVTPSLWNTHESYGSNMEPHVSSFTPVANCGLMTGAISRCD